MAVVAAVVLTCLAGVFWWFWLSAPDDGVDPNTFVWFTAWLLTFAAAIALVTAGVVHLRRRRHSRRGAGPRGTRG